MTLKQLADEANKLIKQGVDPETPVYLMDDQCYTEQVSSLLVRKVKEMQEYCSGDILAEEAETVITV